jgi:hypothetical protein
MTKYCSICLVTHVCEELMVAHVSTQHFVNFPASAVSTRKYHDLLMFANVMHWIEIVHNHMKQPHTSVFGILYTV